VEFWRAAGRKRWFTSSLAFGADIEVRFGNRRRDASDGKLDSWVDTPIGALPGALARYLGIVARAGIVRSERHSRSIIYRADLDGLRALTLLLVKDCCAGSLVLCAPLLAQLAPCC
jgi:hypothetical protein